LSVKKRQKFKIEVLIFKTDFCNILCQRREEFYCMAVVAVRPAKAYHSDKDTALFAEPYMRARLNRDEEDSDVLRDGMIILQELPGVYLKASVKCKR